MVLKSLLTGTGPALRKALSTSSAQRDCPVMRSIQVLVHIAAGMSQVSVNLYGPMPLSHSSAELSPKGSSLNLSTQSSRWALASSWALSAVVSDMIAGTRATSLRVTPWMVASPQLLSQRRFLLRRRCSSYFCPGSDA